MKSLAGFRLLPLLMMVAAISFGLRFNDVYAKMSGKGQWAGDLSALEPSAGSETVSPPPADQLKPEGKEEAKTPETAPPPVAAAAPKKTEPKVGAETEDAPLDNPPKEGWKGADDLDDEYSDVKMELFQDLSKRRKDIEAKEKELVMREALIKAAQAELEQKTKELATVKADIETLLKKQTEQEDKRIMSLVKIYEGMKAKDAARIFNSLDIDVLLQVVTKMAEKKSAPIIAAMDEDKARNLTILLAQQNKLPTLVETTTP